MKTLEFRETSQADLKQVQALWSCGEVMKFVGFPNGLHQTGAQMEEWLGWIISARPKANHYSIYEDGIYCGEAFYQIDERTRSAALDIKLLPFARGRGIAARALSHAIEAAFNNGAEKVWVDPNPLNQKAIALYERLGMQRKPMPSELFDRESADALYFELQKRVVV